MTRSFEPIPGTPRFTGSADQQANGRWKWHLYISIIGDERADHYSSTIDFETKDDAIYHMKKVISQLIKDMAKIAPEFGFSVEEALDLKTNRVLPLNGTEVQ